jgi:preprotein translocase subunit SecG
MFISGCSMFFGNLFVYFQFQGKTHIDAHTRQSVFIVLLIIAAIGIVFLLLLRPAQNADGEMIRKDEGGPMNALRRAFALLITKEMILLSVTFFYTGKLTYVMKFITFW